MKRAKRILSLLLSLCLVFGLVPGTAFAASSNLPFTDVNTTDWYYNAVQYAYEKGMMSGTSTTTFAPNATTTRGMIVTILHRMEGTPAATGTAFTDVPAGQWYSDAVSWASANGIVGGYGNGLFGPGDPITREQMAAILNRYSTHKGYDTGTAGSIAGFSDAAQVSSYAVEPMAWAVGNGLISGTGNNTLAPEGNATRAQVATILMRFCENVADRGNTTPETPVEKTYTVTFDLNYGSNTQYDTKTVKEGETVSKPSNPSRSGYSFNGWYAEKSGGRQFDFKTGITSDLTLYAHWTSNSSGNTGSGGSTSGGSNPPIIYYYTVTFDVLASDVSNIPAAQQVRSGGLVTEPSAPARGGYNFVGWYVDNSYTEKYDFKSPVTTNITLYAKWNPISSGEEQEPTRDYTAPEEYFAANSTGIRQTIRDTESNDVMTEAEAVMLMDSLGFGQSTDENGVTTGFPVIYQYALGGEYLGETTASAGSSTKHPMYKTYYISGASNLVLWTVYITNGEVFATPTSFLYETTCDKEVLLTRDGTFTSYYNGLFYVTVPNENVTITQTVAKVDAATLDTYTFDTLCVLTGATALSVQAEVNQKSAEEPETVFEGLPGLVAYSGKNIEAIGTEEIATISRVQERAVIVSMGDSYSSGEGIEPFIHQDWSWPDKVRDEDFMGHRSTKSWPLQLRVPNKEVTHYFVASTGAVTANIDRSEQKQEYDRWFNVSGTMTMPLQTYILDRIGSSVDYVTMTIGGNDVKFADIIQKCVTESSYLNAAIGKESKLEKELNSLWNNIGNTMQDIERVYKSVHRKAPNATIIIAGYPQLLERSGKGCFNSEWETWLINSKVSQFNDQIELLVNRCKTSMKIEFVDVEEAFRGHEAYADDEWINGVILLWKDQDFKAPNVASSYSVHPNGKGAQAYARCVNAKIRELEARENNIKTLFGRITIADRDTDLTNNLPLPGATVTLTGTGFLDLLDRYTAETGHDGRYSIGNLPSGDYRIFITCDGYIPVTEEITIGDDLQNQYDATVEAIPIIFSGSGTASGKVTDALTGQGVAGLTLNIRKGINVITGDIVATVTTGSDGSYTTPTIDAGNYSVEIVDERTLSGGDIRYLNNVFVIKVLGNHAIPNQNGYVTSSLQANQLRIVLKWGEQPRDLDSHLVGPAVEGGGFHVYYSDRNYEVNSTLVANLDLDDTDSYGPETTTIYEMAPGVYTYMIHDYTNRYSDNSTALSSSGAYIEVFLGSSTVAAYTFYAPSGGGTLWTVFSYNSNTGVIQPINTMSYHESPSTVGSEYWARDGIATQELIEDPLKDYEITELQNSEKNDTSQDNQSESVNADNSNVEDIPSLDHQEPENGNASETENISTENDQWTEDSNISEEGNASSEETVANMLEKDGAVELGIQA